MINLQQIRAYSAFEAAKLNASSEEYVRLVKDLPAMLQSNGLLATWAFFLGKAKGNSGKPHNIVLSLLLAHLHQSALAFDIPAGVKSPDTFFTQFLVNPENHPSGSLLMKLTAESIRYSTWLKRAGEAFEKGGNNATT